MRSNGYLRTQPIQTGLLLLLTGLSLLAVNGTAQENDTIVPLGESPRNILRKIDIRQLSNYGFNFWQDKFSGNWAGIDFGVNGFIDPDYSGYSSDFMKNDLLRSNSTFINLIQQSIGLQRNRNTIGLVTGIGLHLQSYRLDKNTTIRENDNGVIEPEILWFDQNQKSKLSLVSLMVPLLAEFQIPIRHYDNRLYISGGVYGSWLLSSHTKIKYRADGEKEKLKVPGQYSIHDLKYGVMLRTGYRWVNLFATYDLVPLFREDKGPRLIPFSIGISLIRF